MNQFMSNTSAMRARDPPISLNNQFLRKSTRIQVELFSIVEVLLRTLMSSLAAVAL